MKKTNQDRTEKYGHKVLARSLDKNGVIVLGLLEQYCGKHIRWDFTPLSRRSCFVLAG